MDSSETIQPGLSEPPACSLSAELSAYFDGELEAAASRHFEQHLGSCEPCRRELEEIGELSALAAEIGAEGISTPALRKIHRAIDAEERYSLFRIAAVMTGLAASALVIGGVWLSEVPTAAPQRQTILVDTFSSAPWQQVATDLHVDPLPQSDLEIRNQQMFADARLADWMVNGLSGRAR